MEAELIKDTPVYFFTNGTHADERGDVTVPYQIHDMYQAMLRDTGNATIIPMDIQQQTISRSHNGVTRGIHFSPYGKLVTCLSGIIYDHLVVFNGHVDDDFEVISKTVRLDAAEGGSLLIPPGVGHGFTTGTEAVVSYLSWGTWKPDLEVDVNIDSYEIRLGHVNTKTAIMSEKDRYAPTFSQLIDSEWDKLKAFKVKA